MEKTQGIQIITYKRTSKEKKRFSKHNKGSSSSRDKDNRNSNNRTFMTTFKIQQQL